MGGAPRRTLPGLIERYASYLVNCRRVLRPLARGDVGAGLRQGRLVEVTRRLRVGCEFVHQSEIDVPAVFQVEPLSDQKVDLVDERWSLEPDVPTHAYSDLYGNPCRRLIMPAGRSVISYKATVIAPNATEDVDEEAPELTPDQLPDEVLIYILPSRFCLPDVLGAEAWSRFGTTPPGYGRVQAICDYVHGHLQFEYGASNPMTTAADAHTTGYGVCRDFTHLAVSFCRALNIPARYVFGYLPEIEVPHRDLPMDFAAWMEVYLGDRWWTFDPRNNERRKGRVLIGRGRDASDVAMATTFGAPLLESMIVISEEAAEG
jgi:transglutaminase-like putative cysteine protease